MEIASVVGPVIEVGQFLAAPIKRQFSYLCYFNSNVESLKDEARRLDSAKVDLEMQVAHEENNAQVIVSDVKTLLVDATEIQVKARGIEAEICNVQSGCLAIKLCFMLSRKAKKTAEVIKKLLNGCKFDTLSMRPPPASMVPSPLGQVCDFLSRKHLEEDVMKALREKKVNMMGICGMGGIGKTAMAKKLMHGLTEEKLFDEVLMVVVGQQVDMLNIQQQIAELLGLKLEEKTLQARAHRLRVRLTGNKRIFIVMDDIWDTIKLEDLGITCESGIMGCTILLTSRSMDVLLQMNAEVFALQILSKEEAWSLFRDKVGSCVDDPNLCYIAGQIAKECKGLPIALVTVVSALKDQKSVAIWNDALRQMKGSDLKNMHNLHKEVYLPLRLSYDHLNNQDAEYLFLLCSQFPEDYNINLHDLTIYCMGLRLFEGISSVKQTRDRIFTLVEMLKIRSLLLDGHDKNFVKMHDIIRDVAIVIASEKGLVDVNLKSHCNSGCKWLLMFPETCNVLPSYLVGSNYPRLHILAIHDTTERRNKLKINSLPSFEQMKELRSLYLRYPPFKPFPQTIQYLENLRRLHLVRCSLDCISIIGDLSELEILVCRYCNEIKELPIEIGRLKRLKLLEFEFCSRLKRIALGVIPNLIELEELKMWGSFADWESRNINEDERRNASLKELESLTRLTLLWIQVKDVHLVEENISLPSSIVNYKIAFGNMVWAHVEKAIVVNGLPQDIKCENWIHQLIVRTFDVLLSLDGDGSRNCDLSQLHNNIKSLQISHCERIEVLVPETTISIDWRTSCGVFPILECLKLHHLANLKEMYVIPIPKESTLFKNLKELDLRKLPKLKSLWRIMNQNVSLNNLTNISLRHCDKLQNLFFLEKGKDVFLQLKLLQIEDCQMMEEVFYNDENENDGKNSVSITFPKLKTLVLGGLSNLMTFSKGFECIELPFLTKLEIWNCPKLTTFVSFDRSNLNPNLSDDQFQLFNNQKVAFGSLKFLYVHGNKSCNIWCSQASNYLFRELEVLDVRSCPNIKSLCSSSMTEHFVSIKCLGIGDCKEMERVVIANDQGFLEIFPDMEIFQLYNLPKLEKICDITILTESNAFRNLQKLELIDLPALKHLWNGANQCGIPKRQLLQLEHLTIESCKKVEHVFSSEENGKSSHIIFSKLKELILKDLTSLVTFYDGVERIDFPMLEKMIIYDCSRLVNIVSFTGREPNNVANQDEDVYFHSSCCQKVTFGRLKTLKFGGHIYSSSIWCPQIHLCFFKEIRSLRIWDCREIRILFSLSIVENLVKLTHLSIQSCNKMEKVIEDVERVHGMSILFPSLKWLDIIDLPLLKNLCEWSGAFELPLLCKVVIRNCSRMEFFTLGSPSTMKLKEIILDNRRINNKELRKMGGLNGILRQRMFKGVELIPFGKDWEEEKIENDEEVKIEEDEYNDYEWYLHEDVYSWREKHEQK